MLKYKKDLLLAAIILAVAVVGFLITNQIHKKPAASLEISIDGTVVQVLDLTKDVFLTIPGYRGGSNQLVIENGMAWAIEASCPDQVCIHQGKITLSGQMIVCLPNRMVAEVITQEK